MSREQIELQLREEINRQKAILDVPPSGSFVNGLVRQQTEMRIAEVEEDLSDLLEPRLDWTFVGEEADRHRVPATLFTRVVGRLQRGLTHIGWAFHSGALDEAEPPTAMQRAMALDVVAIATGSFQITFRKPMREDLLAGRLDLDDPHLIETSVDALLSLLDHAERRALDEDMEDLARRLGRGSVKQIQFLMNDLAESGMETKLEWTTAGARKAVSVTPLSAEYLRDWIRSVEQVAERIKVTGVLHGGDDIIGQFKIVDAAENVYEGSADADLLAGRRFGETYVAEIDVVTSVGENVGTRAERCTLRSLQRPRSGEID